MLQSPRYHGWYTFAREENQSEKSTCDLIVPRTVSRQRVPSVSRRSSSSLSCPFPWNRASPSHSVAQLTHSLTHTRRLWLSRISTISTRSPAQEHHDCVQAHLASPRALPRSLCYLVALLPTPLSLPRADPCERGVLIQPRHLLRTLTQSQYKSIPPPPTTGATTTTSPSLPTFFPRAALL